MWCRPTATPSSLVHRQARLLATGVRLLGARLSLLGGRLDYLQHQTTAALSYGRAKHIINVFILPAPEADKPRQSQTIRGFNVVSWQANHMRFVMVSDLEKGELEAFSELLKP
jgi:anti-sigma factor RsiW